MYKKLILDMEGLIFDFDASKNLKLMETRGVGFEEIIFCIQNGKLLDVYPHPNAAKYTNQNIYVVELENYIYLVPFVEEGSRVMLKTIFPSRKATKKYLGNNAVENENE